MNSSSKHRNRLFLIFVLCGLLLNLSDFDLSLVNGAISTVAPQLNGNVKEEADR